jgi:SPFH domain / Band 7 family
MNPAEFFTGLLFPAAVFALALLLHLRKIPQIYITDYTRGVRFVKGAFRDVLGPGVYQPFTRGVQVQIVDMRPVPIILDRIFYRDASQSDSIASIGAALIVIDPHLASTAIKDKINDSVPVVRDALRSVLSRGISDASPESRAKNAEDIAAAANEELRRFGMKISSVEITEVASRPGAGRLASSPN